MRYKLLVILLLLSFTASARWEYRITTQKAIGMEFENEPSSLVNSINAQNGTNFVGARPIRRPK